MTEIHGIPEDLKQRLLAAGVEDEASLHAALANDSALRAAYENWLISMTLQRFAAAPDAPTLRELVERAPLLLEDSMIDAIEQAIRRAQAAGDEGSVTALSQRLLVLHQIKAEHERSRLAQPLVEALVQFVQARDEIEARAVFAAYRNLLVDDDAEAFLINQFEAEDPTARLLLEQRLELLRKVRMGG